MKTKNWYDAMRAALADMQEVHDMVEEGIRNFVEKMVYAQDGIVRPVDFVVKAEETFSVNVVIPAHTAVQNGKMIKIDSDEIVSVLGADGIGLPAPTAGKRYTSIFVKYPDSADRELSSRRLKWFIDTSVIPPVTYQDYAYMRVLDGYEVLVVHGATETNTALMPVPPADQAGYIRYADILIIQGAVVVTGQGIEQKATVFGPVESVTGGHTHDGVSSQQVDWNDITDKPGSFTPSKHSINIADGFHTGVLSFATHGLVKGTGMHPFTAITGEISDDQHGSRQGGSSHPVATSVSAGFMSADDKAKLDSISDQTPDLAMVHLAHKRELRPDVITTELLNVELPINKVMLLAGLVVIVGLRAGNRPKIEVYKNSITGPNRIAVIALESTIGQIRDIQTNFIKEIPFSTLPLFNKTSDKLFLQLDSAWSTVSSRSFEILGYK